MRNKPKVRIIYKADPSLDQRIDSIYDILIDNMLESDNKTELTSKITRSKLLDTPANTLS